MIGKIETKVSGLELGITELYAAQVGTSICESVHNVFSKVHTVILCFKYVDMGDAYLISEIKVVKVFFRQLKTLIVWKTP